eukprot:UC4_evm1s573
MTDEEKKQYHDMAAEEKDRYEEELAQYIRENPDAAPSHEGPKKPMSAYMAWLNDNRAKIKSENPTLINKDIAVKAGE